MFYCCFGIAAGAAFWFLEHLRFASLGEYCEMAELDFAACVRLKLCCACAYCVFVVSLVSAVISTAEIRCRSSASG